LPLIYRNIKKGKQIGSRPKAEKREKRTEEFWMPRPKKLTFCFGPGLGGKKKVRKASSYRRGARK